MRPITCAFEVVIVAAFCGVLASATAQNIDLHDRLKEITAASTLEKEGMAPWHLHMTFQLYDLDGRKKNVGTIEEWWSPTAHRKIVIDDPSSHLGSTGDVAPQNRREDFLVHQLLSQVVNPVPQYRDSDHYELYEETQNVGRVKLSCLILQAVGPAGKTPSASGSPHLCTDPGGSVLRLYSESNTMYDVRNTMGKFRGVELGIDNTITYNGKPAISGHVDVLEGDNPTEQKEIPAEAPPAPARVAGGVLAGSLINKQPPTYPDDMKMKHMFGTVVLRAVISKTGTITSLDVIASPSPSFSDSATEAVKHWLYHPYLLNGKPTEVDTTITINYNLNGG